MPDFRDKKSCVSSGPTVAIMDRAEKIMNHLVSENRDDIIFQETNSRITDWVITCERMLFGNWDDDAFFLLRSDSYDTVPLLPYRKGVEACDFDLTNRRFWLWFRNGTEIYACDSCPFTTNSAGAMDKHVKLACRSKGYVVGRITTLEDPLRMKP